jgi:translocation and assembly module TamB
MKLRWRHLWHVVWTSGLLICAAIILIWNSGLVNLWLRRYVVGQIERSTGARVELGRFHLQLWGLHIELDNLTLHGLEDSGMPPLVHADKVRMTLKIVSFFRRTYTLDELILDRPEVAIRYGADGKNNVPAPPRTSTPAAEWQAELFGLKIGKLQINDGAIFYNDAQAPLAAEGENFEFVMNYEANGDTGAAATTRKDIYAGKLNWEKVEIAAKRFMPFRTDIATKFTLSRDGISLDELKLKLPHSEVDGRAEMASFASNDWKLRYRGHLSLEDVRTILRKPTTPDCDLEFAGTANVTNGDWTGAGHFDGHEIDLPYVWFHVDGLEAWGDYQITTKELIVPELHAKALGGTLDGRLAMQFKNTAFRVDSKLRGMSLAQIFAALENPDFPVKELEWDSVLDADAVNTWSGGFDHFETKGLMHWTEPQELAPGKIPATAKIDFDYSQDTLAVVTKLSEISTPTSRITMDGPLGGRDSGLEVTFHTEDLQRWDEFIGAIRGKESGTHVFSGVVDWNGRLLGPIVGPTFVGQLRVEHPGYDDIVWDELTADMDYSPDDLELTNVAVKRGHSSATGELRLKLDGDFDFAADSLWDAHVEFTRNPLEELQTFAGTHLPVTGTLSGQFSGSGTRAAPTFDGNVELEQIEAWGVKFEKLTGQLHSDGDQIRFAKAQLVQSAKGKIGGEVSYKVKEKEIEFALNGEGIALENIPELQTRFVPVGGTFGFDAHAQGPISGLQGEAALRFEGLKFGAEAQGNLEAHAVADGRKVHLEIASQMGSGNLQGSFDLGLGGEYPVSGSATALNFDLDPLMGAGARAKGLTGHTIVSGNFVVAGGLADLGSLSVDANISTIALDYEFVTLKNQGPAKVTFRRKQISISAANLQGADSDFHIAGSARFDGTRPVNLDVSGKVNLQLLAGLLPDLHARGGADVRVVVEGTMSNPLITGRVGFTDASLSYADFPTGLSHLKGDIVFDRTQALFDNLHAQTGGGDLTLSGSMSYGDGPLRYQLDAVAPQVRVRYPVGMSWLVGGTLHLTGGTDAAILSGSVQVLRLLFAEGVDMATLLTASSGSVQGPATTSAFLRNLQFDLEGTTAPNARMQWTGAQVELEGTMRLRGTWERPILLGNIHLLNGEMSFRGNKYSLSRGDIIFSNPFRLDPILNVEATTTISQYEVTLDFTGAASNLSLSYRSDPPLPDSDIIALLALGSTGTESALRSSSANTTQGYGATALLSEAISSQFGGTIERLFGISRFRVDPFLAGTASEQNAAARVTIEEQLGKAVTITYSSNAASQQEQVIQVEYAVRRDISIVGLRDINGTYSLSVVFTKHFK